jgi:hypothetical protein
MVRLFPGQNLAEWFSRACSASRFTSPVAALRQQLTPELYSLAKLILN